jgi:hypothetical protein
LDATYLSAKPIFYTHIKHHDVDYHFVHDRAAKKVIQIHFISFNDQLANVLTKPLSTDSFTALRFKFRVEPPPST